MADVAGSKVNEITINTRRLALSCKKNKKASGVVDKLKKFIQKQWKSTADVHLSDDLNKKIWSRGNFQCVGRIRICVEKGPCHFNPEKTVFRLSLVDVSSFKGLKDSVAEE